MPPPRVSRGRASQAILARWFQKTIWPSAESLAASLPGRDITGTPGAACEVKATEGIDLTGWLRQAAKNAQGDLPFAVYRPRGFGEEKVQEWPVVIRLVDFTNLLLNAGYGSKEKQ